MDSKTASPKGPKANIVQTIKSKANETEYSAEIVGQTVYVHNGKGTHNLGSSKVKLTNRSDFNWEYRYYPGNLVAAHINGRIIAYAMKGKDGGMVRVSNLKTDLRAIIKNFKEDIKDLAFSYSQKEIILGIVDSEGNILVYKIVDDPTNITYNLLLHIYHHGDVKPKVNYRLIWCPFYPAYDEEDLTDDPQKMFVVLNGNKAEVCNFSMMAEKYDVMPIDPDSTHEGYIEIVHTADLVDASFSSDGAAIAVASTDGTVKFLQLYMLDNDRQKVLHEWRPHNGEPLSSIIFIDNVLKYSLQCWKFTITGAKQNTEIKLWSCETWTCLQTIHFPMEVSPFGSHSFMKMSIDYTGQYLVITNINDRVLYVLELKRYDQEQLVHVTTFSQFLLPNPFLSYHILEACNRKVPYSHNSSSEDLLDDEDQGDYDDDQDSDRTDVCLQMLVIQPKKFQDCCITFQPEALFDKCVSKEVEKIPNLDELQNSVTLLIQQQASKSQLNLMTPEDFTLPVVAQTTSPDPEKPDIKQEPSENLIDFHQQKNVFASGGSSPSLEVQEILSNYENTQDYFDGLGKREESVQSLGFRVASLENLVKEQNILLGKFERTLSELVKNSATSHNSVTTEDLVKVLDNAMSKQHLSLSKLFTIQKTSEREAQDKIVAGVTQILTKWLGENIKNIVDQEIRHVFTPSIRQVMESHKKQVDLQYAQTLSNTEIMVKENIAKALNNKSWSETLSLSVVNIVAPSLEKGCKDIIASSLIPSWEKICKTMFQQINETFMKGTKEYVGSVENLTDKQRKAQQKIIGDLQAVSENMKTIRDTSTNMTSEFHVLFKGIEEKLTKNIKDVVAEQVRQGLQNHAGVIEESVINAVRSRAVTPSLHVDSHVIMGRIQSSLTRGNLVEAFQLALSAENLSFVVYVCERADVNKVFGDECILQQSCLLALLQQLSMDLQNNTELKLSFMRQGLAALQTDCPNTKQFIPKVLKEMLKQLSNFMQLPNAPKKYFTEARLLEMAVKGMVNTK